MAQPWEQDWSKPPTAKADDNAAPPWERNWSAPPTKADDTGNVGRGFKEAFQQVPQLGYGLLAGTGAAIESAFGEGGIGTGLKKAGVKGYSEWGDKIEAGSKPTDSFDYAWSAAKEGDIGALGAWIAHGLGYAGGQAVQMLATAGLGAVAGKATLGTVAKSLAEGMVQKEAAALAATDAAKSLTAEQVTKLATQAVASKLGQTAAIGASAFGMEGGEIFGDLAQEATKEGKTLTGEQLAKAFGATLAAGGLEFVGDKVGLDVMLGKSKLLKPAEAVTGMKGRAARAGVAALGAAPIEGATEYGQTLLEEAGKGHDPFSDESLKQAKDAAALGALGGAAMGGAGGALQSAKPKATASDVLAAPTIDEAANKALLAISGPTKAAEWEVVDGALALPGPAAQQQPEVLKALPGPDGQPVFMADDKGNVSVQPAAARVEALNRGFDAQQAADAAAADAMSLGKQAPVGLRPSEQPAPAVPVGEATEVPFIPTGEATEVERIPTGEASELLPTGEATEVPRKIATGKASEPDAGLVETIHADDLLTGDGVPYGSKVGANIRAKREGLTPDHVVEIPGAGWVIRPNLSVRSQPQQTPINAQPNNTRGTTAADVIQGPRDANRTDVGGNPGRGAADGGAGTGAGSVVQGQQPEARADGLAPGTGSGADERAGAVPTGPGRGNDALKAGAVFTLDGKTWTVQEVKDSAIAVRDAENNTRMVARNSKTFQKITAALQPAATAPEPATAETNPQPQGAQADEVTIPQQEKQVQTVAGALAPAAQNSVQQAPAEATHADPGEKPEAVTPATVKESLTVAAKSKDRKPSAMKADLLAQVDAAMAEASDESLPVWKEPTKAQVRQAMVDLKMSDLGRAEKALRNAYDNRVAEASRRIGFKTFDVPGDGVFKVLNTRDRLADFRKKVEASQGFKDGATKAPAPERINGGGTRQESGARFGVESGSGSKVAAFDNMVNEGDLEAASDYADAVGLTLDPNKVANATKVLKWREQRDAARPAEPEAAAQPAQEAEPKPAEQPAPAEAATTILDAAGVTGKERLDALKDVKAGTVTPEELAAAYPAKQEAEAEKAKPAAPIQDFGEKLEGARKDYAATLKDAMALDVASEPLSKSWPEPDYQKMLDAGADPFTVAWAHASRDEVPTKPVKGWKLKGWVDQVKELRDTASRLMSGEVSKAALLDSAEFARVRRNVASRAELYELVGHGKSLKGVSFGKHHYALYRGESNVTKWVVEQEAKATAFSNWPRELAVADTKEDALAQFKAKYDSLDLGSKAKGQAQFSIYRKRGVDGTFIGKKIGREYIDLMKVADVAAARKYMVDNLADLEKRLEQYKGTPFERKADNQPRAGEDHRNGAPVTPEVFADTFGFRGVQFGNYVEQGRRQSDLNQAFDALMDMAAVLGIPPRALSLNGRLGLAFGARGTGGKNAPAAHYEPGKVVINLTKGNGPGSLAHEWWHALDNYFANQAVDGQGGFVTEAARPDALREQMKAAFNAVKRATQAKGLRARSAELDKRRTKAYWNTGAELSARSFETYVIAKLEDQNAANDYLANVVSKEAWDADESMRAMALGQESKAETYPYPVVDEMPAVRAAFDDFFKTVETREDDRGNIALFSRATDTIPLDQSDAIGREFWRKIKEGETFTEQEVLNALSINRRGSRRDARSLEVTSGGPTTGESIVHWSGEIAGFDGYRTSAAWVADSFTVFVIPEELAAGADLSDSTQARGRAIVAYAFTPLRGGLYELAINDVAPDSTAESALRERGKLQDAGIESNPYRRVDIGHTLSRALLQESIRRLALNIGQTPSVYYAQRDTGARAGQDGSGRGFDAERVERNFSRSGRTGRGISITDAEAIAADIRATMPTAPQIVVVESVSQLPDKLRNLIEQAGADNDVEGVYWGGKVYAVTSHFSDLDRFRFVVAHHELRHHGFGAMLGPRLHRMMMQIYRSNAKVRALADQNIRDGIAKDVVVATEEALADMPVEDLVKLRGWQRIVAAVREFLRNLAMKLEKRHPKLADMLRPEGWTDEDIARLISRAEDMSRTGEPDYVRGGAVFSGRATNGAVPADTNAPGQSGDAQGADSGKSVTKSPYVARDFTPAPKDRMSIAMIREANRRGRLHAKSGDFESYYTPVLQVAYDLGHQGVDLSNAPIVTGVRYGKAPDSGVSRNAADQISEAGTSLAQVRGENEIASTIWFRDRKAYEYRGVLTGEGSDGEALILPLHVENLDGNLPGVNHAQALKEQLANQSDQSAPDSDGAPRFSRARPNITAATAPSAMAEALQSFGDTKLPGDYIISDFIQSHGKLSWWDKTVGSMHNLAQRNPLFKPVYDRAQDFLNAVSTFATEAADLAPTLLPKLEGLRDLGKSPLSAEDTKAISAPIFEGTLLWTRDENGQIVREEDPQKAGVVWRDDELRSRYKLNDHQIKLYREFRAATNKSLTDMTIADMIRFGGADVLAVRDRAMALGDVTAAGDLLAEHLTRMADEDSDRAGVLIDTAGRIMGKAEQAVNLMSRGYAPLTRFGHYTLDVTDAKGQRVYFGLFESQAEANRFARKMRAAYPDGTIQQGTLSQEAYKMFAGISPETAELFGQMLGLEAQGDDAASQAFQEYLKLAKSNRSAMKRLIERKGIAGFSEDAGRVLAGFVYSNARQAAKNLHMGAMNDAVQAIAKAKGKGELLDTAVRLHQYIANPVEEAQKIKGLMFTQFLGGSLAAGLVNLSQLPMLTFPYLSQFGGVAKAASNLKRGLSDALKWETAKTDAQRTTGDSALDKALKRAEEDGIVSPQEIHSLIAQANGSGALKAGDGTKAGNAAAFSSNLLSKIGLLWGTPFAIAEQFNRRATFIAAYRTAVEQGMENPAQFAEQAVTETQFSYTKANRPEWARGALGSVLFTFKTFSISYVELLYRMAKSGPEGKKAALLALGVMFLMAGMQGLPGADDLDDIIDGILQRMGYNFSSKQAKREFFAKLMGEGGAQFMMRGVSGLPGAPIDVANRLGLGNLIPGTGLFTKKTDHTSDVMEIGGPALSFGKQLLTAADQLTQGNFGKAVESVLPVAAANAVKAIDMASSGMYRDQAGRKVIDTDAYDAVAKAIGFQPNDVSKVQTATREVQQMVALNKMRETEIADQWAQAIFDNDPAGKDAARQALEAWNRDNPESPIKITTAQLLKRLKAMREDKITRMEHTAPKEIRATVHRELTEATR